MFQFQNKKKTGQDEIAYFNKHYRDELLGFDFDRNEIKVPKGIVQSLQFKIDKFQF